MKLYSYDAAPNPRRVLLNLKHKGVSIDVEQVDLMKQEQMTAEFKAVNERCTVPVLELDDGTRLCDVIAMTLYLDEVFPEVPLFGRNALERAQIVGWCHRIYFDGFVSVAEVFRNANPAFAGRALPGPVGLEQTPALIDRGNIRLDAFYADMDRVLSDRAFLVGDALSQADIDLYVTLGFCGWARRSIPEACTVLSAWNEKMKAHFNE